MEEHGDKQQENRSSTRAGTTVAPALVIASMQAPMTASMPPQHRNGRGDYRMSRAVEAKLQNPHSTLSECLAIGNHNAALLGVFWCVEHLLLFLTTTCVFELTPHKIIRWFSIPAWCYLLGRRRGKCDLGAAKKSAQQEVAASKKREKQEKHRWYTSQN
jgi:hypothetical protein